MAQVALWDQPLKELPDWPGVDQAVRLTRALMAVVADRYGPGCDLLATMILLYNDDGWGLPVQFAVEELIADKAPIPAPVVELYREVGATLMADDPEFMDDYYEDLLRLAA